MSQSIYNKNSFMIIGLTFASLLAFPIVTPALPSIRDALNISTENIGWVLSAFSLPGIFFMPLSGLLADRFGKRIILIPSVFLFGLAGFACAFASNLETLIAFRFLQGIGASALATINVAMVGDYFQGNDRVRIMGGIGAMQNIGSGLLPLLGGALAALAWNYPFMSSLLAIPLGIYLIYAMEEVRSEDEQAKAGTGAFIGNAWNQLNNRVALELIFMTTAFIFIGFGAFITYIPLVLKDAFGAPEQIIGVIIAARASMGVVTATLLARLTRIFSYRTIICSAFASLTIGLGFVPFAQNQWMIIFTAMCYGAAFGIIRPSLQVLLLENSPENLRSTFASAANFGVRLAQTIAPIVAGLFLIVSDYDGLYTVAAILAAMMTLYSLTAVSLRQKQKDTDS